MSPEFSWRTGEGTFLLPSAMTTRHLFLTLRRIWDSMVPDEHRIAEGPRPTFSPDYYGTPYLILAFETLMAELMRREDLEPRHKLVFDRMAAGAERIEQNPPQPTAQAPKPAWPSGYERRPLPSRPLLQRRPGYFANLEAFAEREKHFDAVREKHHPGASLDPRFLPGLLDPADIIFGEEEPKRAKTRIELLELIELATSPDESGG